MPTPHDASDLPVARSLLFVPGHRPERFPKALASGADLVCLDLEDAVGADAKNAARREVLASLAGSGETDRLCVRINRLGSASGLEDAVALLRTPAAVRWLMLPKVESPRDVELLAQAFSTARRPRLIALIESPAGLESAFEIARSPRVAMLLFGSFDYAAESGCAQDWPLLLPARSRVVAAAASAGKVALDGPFAALDEPEAAAAEARNAKALGFLGKAAVHPGFIADINEAFTPTPEELSQARAVIEAYESAGGSAGRIGGTLVEAPLVLRMRRLLSRSHACASADSTGGPRRGRGHD